VCIEEQFYLVWPWLNAWLRPEALRRAAWLLALAGIAFRIYAAASGWCWTVAWFNTLGHLDALGFGALATMELGKLKVKPLERAILILIGFACPILVARVAPLSGIGTLPVTFPSALLYTPVGVCSATLVWALATSPVRHIDLFSHPVSVFLGRISFGLYAFHTLAKSLLDPLFSPHRWPLEWVVCFSLTLALAWSSFRFFESRFLAIKARFQVIPSGSPSIGDIAATQPP
jgi:peptidoglycan/LPS O-acetylase OafA/YrhL